MKTARQSSTTARLAPVSPRRSARLREVVQDLSGARSAERGPGRSSVEALGALVFPDLEAARRAHPGAQAEMARAGRALAIGEFAALVAHETNQPIAAILLNCAAARNYLSEPNADLSRVRESIERIERGVNRAGAVIQRIRSLITNVQPEYKALDLNHLIEEALCLLGHELGQAGVVVTKALQPDLPLVLGDRVQLEQVLINLYSNAIEAMRSTPAGARVLTVGTGLEGGRLFVTVRDTGPGVEPQALERLFDPLFTTKADGIGLGLSISRSIVEVHGGQLWTAPGASAGASMGACFCFTLCAAVEQTEVDAPLSNVARLPARDVTEVGAFRSGVPEARSA